MKRRLMTEHAFGEEAKNGPVSGAAVFRFTEAPASTDIGISNRCVPYILSTPAVARDFHTIALDGWDLTAYRANPVFLWAHDGNEPPIGRMNDIGVVGGALRGVVQYADADTYPFADTIFRLVKGGFLNAVSVSWKPRKFEYSKDRSRPGGINFLEQELLEVSQCPVPCQPEALATARAAGIDTGPLVAWAERILDSGETIVIPRAELENLRKEAKMPAQGRRSAAGSDWKVGAARDLPVDTASAWDGPAAAERMFEAAGFNGDNPDADKAKRGFLFYDAASPTEKGSYKEPFADIVGGELKAMKGGLDAAAQRISATDVPGAVRDEGAAVLESYKTADAEARTAVVAARRTAARYQQRGLYDVMWLAGTVMDLGYIVQCCEEEAAREGDGSKVPEMLAGILKQLGAALIAMTAEEVGELVGGEDDPNDDFAAEDDLIMRAAGALRSNVLRMLRHAAAPAIAKVNARAAKDLDPRTLALLLKRGGLSASGQAQLADMILSRQGKVLSADNEVKLRAACDHMRMATEHVNSVVDQNLPDDDPLADPDAGTGDDDGAAERALRARQLREAQAAAAVLAVA